MKVCIIKFLHFLDFDTSDGNFILQSSIVPVLNEKITLVREYTLLQISIYYDIYYFTHIYYCMCKYNSNNSQLDYVHVFFIRYRCEILSFHIYLYIEMIHALHLSLWMASTLATNVIVSRVLCYEARGF